MTDWLQTYAGIAISVVLVVIVGVLVSRGLLDGGYANLATGLILGGGGGLVVGTKITPKE